MIWILTVDSLRLDSIASAVQTNQNPEIGNIGFNQYHTIVILSIFIIERIISNITAQRLNKWRFFLEVIVQNNLDLIESFFDEIKNDTLIASENLKDVSGTEDHIAQLKQNQLTPLKGKKREFDHRFISLVSSTYEKKAINLQNCLNEVEDIVTKTIEQNSNQIDWNEFERTIRDKRKLFFQILNKRPIW